MPLAWADSRGGRLLTTDVTVPFRHGVLDGSLRSWIPVAGNLDDVLAGEAASLSTALSVAKTTGVRLGNLLGRERVLDTRGLCFLDVDLIPEPAAALSSAVAHM